MASKNSSSLGLFLVLSLMFFGLTAATCPNNALKLRVCANVLRGLAKVDLGKPAVEPCCSLVEGIADLEAAACLCTVVRANVLGLNLRVPIDLSVLLNVCNRNVRRGFQCR